MVRWRSLLLGGAVSAVCLYLLLSRVDLGKTWDAFTSADPFWIAATMPLIMLAVVIRCWRWQLLFLPHDRVRLWSTITSTLIGYMFNSVLPGRVGELARASLISRTDSVSTSRAVGTIFVEKILDILALLVMLGALTAIMPLPSLVTSGGVAAAIAFGAVAIVFFVLSNCRAPFVRWAERFLDHLPVLRRVQPSRVADMVLGAADGLRDPRRLAAQIVVSLVLWATAALTVVVTMQAFHLNVPWTVGALVLVATNLGMTVPSAPASVGVYHWLVVVVMTFFGVDEAAALAFAFVVHALAFGSFVIVGALLLVLGLARQEYEISDLWRWQHQSIPPPSPAPAPGMGQRPTANEVAPAPSGN